MHRGWRASIFLGLLLVLMAVLPALAAPNDPFFNQQWGLQKIEAERAWGPGNSGSGVVVAVVDTGVNFGHEDLTGHSAGSINMIKDQGSDACLQGEGDNNGHGTEVSGVIAAASGNNVGVASVAPGARILSVKVLDCNGGGYVSDVADGIREAVNRGAKVINLSLGPDLPSHVVSSLLGGSDRSDIHEAVTYAARSGALVVAAAGNDILTSYYAGETNVLIVGATGPEDRRASYSSGGQDVYAPGGDGNCGGGRCIVTTSKNGDYTAVQGTSFAAPHVSGVAALLYAKGFTNPVDVRNRILASAEATPDGPRVNAARAVEAPAPPPPANTTDSTSPGGVQSQGTGTNNQVSSPQAKQAAAAAAAVAKAAASQTPGASPGAGVTPGAPVPGGSAPAGPDLSQLPVLPVGGAAGSGAAGGPDPLHEFATSGSSGSKRGLKILSALAGMGALAGAGAWFYGKRVS